MLNNWKNEPIKSLHSSRNNNNNNNSALLVSDSKNKSEFFDVHVLMRAYTYTKKPIKRNILLPFPFSYQFWRNVSTRLFPLIKFTASVQQKKEHMNKSLAHHYHHRGQYVMEFIVPSHQIRFTFLSRDARTEIYQRQTLISFDWRVCVGLITVISYMVSSSEIANHSPHTSCCYRFDDILFAPLHYKWKSKQTKTWTIFVVFGEISSLWNESNDIFCLFVCCLLRF